MKALRREVALGPDLPMLEIKVDPTCRSVTPCFSLFLETGNEESQKLGPDLFLSCARPGANVRPKGRSGRAGGAV
jgi:hypothetical protein